LDKSRKNCGRILLQPASLISELEDAVRSGSSVRRVSTLRRVTDLFLHGGELLSEDQVRVFDDVLCLLIARVESRARAELGARLASIDYAPFEVIRRLARDDEIGVAGNVLTSSSRLRSSDLVDVASTRGQDHLLAISSRDNLPEAVTDVIIDRGNTSVIRNLAHNTSARFSDTGYSKIVACAETDAGLIEILGLRTDLPIKLLRDLLKRATETVRERLMALAPPELREEIKQVLNGIAAAAQENACNFSHAEALIKLLHEKSELHDEAIIKFARTKQFDHVAASVALLAGAPTDMIAHLLEGPRSDLVLIPCKSAGLGWIAVESILRNRRSQQYIGEEMLVSAAKDYGQLSPKTAQRTLRFLQVHKNLES
jgi:uncharacterized protein (DUF2336 family)